MEWPDWQDAGKRITMRLESGQEVTGKLYVADVFFTGEDEVPVFGVKTGAGEEVSFANGVTWRFAP